MGPDNLYSIGTARIYMRCGHVYYCDTGSISEPEGTVEYNDLKDVELLALISTGRQEALGALYDRHSSRVFSLALTLLRDNQDAQEVTQDVFLSVWRNGKSYDPMKASFSTWLSHIAHNRAIDELRKRRKRGAETSIDSVPALDLSETRDEAATEARLEFGRIRKALDNLPQEQKQVLYLSYFQGYTHTEIASILKKPLGTVKTHMRSALRRLRESLGPTGREDV
ncbi:MAG: sigma-70 family RNA polymerase sigma factor [Chloroflexi bacterium]|nr:sigma-70 family RNA polymerase sigma factor [Chloroflexota bacterium]